MKVLRKKVLRDIWRNKSQFITIFLMAFLAVFAFSGVHAYMDGMKESAKVYYNEYNLQDLWITAKDITEDDLENIKKLDNVNDAERLMTIKASVLNSENYVNPDSNKKLDDLTLELNFIESNNINKMYVFEGEKFDKKKEGLWLDYVLAQKLGIKLGDELELSLEGTEFK